MVDRDYCNSSFLALRYVGRSGVDFSDKVHYRYPEVPSNTNRILVSTAQDIDYALQSQIEPVKKKNKKIGILLSGGMDSAILASYFYGIDAYTFRFLGGRFQEEELHRAEIIADKNGMRLHYVDIDWNVVKENIKPIMMSKGGPVHSIEPQICCGAKQAIADGVELMIIGDASDYIFGGMDKLLSKDWTADDFIKRYIYIDPFAVLKEPVDIQDIFDPYRDGNRIDYLRILEELATQESYGSYSNAFLTAGLEYFDPYERLKMSEPLNLTRVRNGDSKYLIRELFRMRYPGFDVPEKNPMPRPVDTYFANWEGPVRQEFRKDINIEQFNGNQKWLMWCLEEFLNMVDEM